MATKAKKAKETVLIMDMTQARKDFCSKVSMLKFEAGALGLFYTMQKLDDAMIMVGYEVAGTPGEYAKAKKANLEAEAKYRRS